MTPYLSFFLLPPCVYVSMCLFVCCEHIMAVCVDIKVQLCVLYLDGVIFLTRSHTHTHAYTESERGRKRYENQSGHHGYISIARHKLYQKKEIRRTLQQHDIRILSTQCPCFIIYAATHYKYSHRNGKKPLMNFTILTL